MMTKRFLNEHNLDFKEVDVDEDEAAMARLRKLGVKSLRTKSSALDLTRKK